MNGNYLFRGQMAYPVDRCSLNLWGWGDLNSHRIQLRYYSLEGCSYTPSKSWFVVLSLQSQLLIVEAFPKLFASPFLPFGSGLAGKTFDWFGLLFVKWTTLPYFEPIRPTNFIHWSSFLPRWAFQQFRVKIFKGFMLRHVLLLVTYIIYGKSTFCSKFFSRHSGIWTHNSFSAH